MQSTGGTVEKPPDEVSWWCKLMARGIGVIGGIVAMVLGIVCCFTIHALCLVGGILELCIGFLVVVLEAPCCCPFFDFVDKIGKFSESRPYWQKGALYTLVALSPPILCFSATTVLGSALVFATGVLYGMMALGKKASREEMIMKVRVKGEEVEMKTGLIGHEESVSLQVPDSPAK